MKKITTVINIADAPLNWQENSKYYYCGRLKYYNNIHNFGNRYRIHIHGSREDCIKKFKADFDKSPSYQKLVLRVLSEKILVCHCKRKDKEVPCHADVLAKYCNEHSNRD